MAKCNQHVWAHNQKKEGHFKCHNCTAKFPCKEDDCGHVDCIHVRKTCKCVYCKKDVDEADRFSVIISSKSHIAHQSCYKDK